MDELLKKLLVTMNKTPDQPTIVFLHGWGSSVNSWVQQLDYFQKQGFKVLAMEMPGFDLPEPNPNWGVPEYADYVIKHLPDRKKRYVFIGHSFGGRVSIFIACHDPEIVDRLVLTNSAGLNLKPYPGRSILILLSKLAYIAQKHVAGVSFLRSIIRNVLGSRGFREATPVMREVMKKVVNLDLQDCLPKIKAKTLIIWGDKDKITPVPMAHALHKSIQDSSLKFIKGAGHSSHKTHANEWNEIVYEFLDK
ncbi:hypothetical protein A2191_03130 [Candidatus Woesebacteria bacterium RIFOXYA1_FULL_38_9]|nr:MAG: hypothetical protein A2191_03130 [Candidatus Woesebacteria bacterium RIFOXYA1_FULL_38_9]